MGIGMFAVGKDDALLEKTFSDAGIDSNFRHCQVANWEDVVSVCLDLENFTDICWTQHQPDVVKSWLDIATKRALQTASCKIEAEIFIKFLQICVELNASLYVF